MIRVGFVFAGSASWTGGLVYLRNLVETVLALPDRQIEPVIIAAPDTPPGDLAGFAGVEVLKSPLAGSTLPVRVLRKAGQMVLGRDLPLERFLRRHRIDVLSHSGYLGPRAAIPAIAWLPDFQHVRMPEFFQPNEIAARDRGYFRIADWSDAILLSSEDARRDLAHFAPDSVAKSHVLHFVAGMVRSDDPRGRAYLAERYGIDRPYLYLPNQFWKHKNHRLVIDALGLLAAEGDAPLVISTGKTEDRRNPSHFANLMALAEANGAAPHFRALGLVPYEDISVLFREAIALINPSHFEGWSTTVEESKSLGKAIILSDIPVHREQAPERAIYVAPDDPAAMATAIRTAVADASPEEDAIASTAATAALPGRRIAFGRRYQEIVLATLRRS